eukprot:scpid88005/ scgid2142/ 
MAWEPEGASAQCFKLSTADIEKKIHSMHVVQWREYAQANVPCYRCLRAGHNRRRCNSSVTCSKCSKKHHILLHDESSPCLFGSRRTTRFFRYATHVVQLLQRVGITLWSATAPNA